MDIFSFSDYREYLKKWLNHARKHDLGNLTRLAEAAQVHTTFLSNVVSGNKNLSLDQATLISEFIKHTPIECDYFFALIEIERAGSVKLKKYWQAKKNKLIDERKKLSSRIGAHRELNDSDRAIYFSSWIYSAIFAAVFINDGQSLDQTAKMFSISREKAESYLNFLVTTGICRLNDSLYLPGETFVYVANESPFVVKHHTNWRIKGIQKMDSRTAEELFVTAPVSLAKSDVPKIREIMAQALQQAMQICKDSKAEEVVCLNIDFFRV